MTEIDYLKCKLEDTEKAFDKLHKRHIELLKQQGKLEKENEQLQKKYDNLYSAIEKTARDMAEKRIYEMEDFDVFQRITDYVEELDE